MKNYVIGLMALTLVFAACSDEDDGDTVTKPLTWSSCYGEGTMDYFENEQSFKTVGNLDNNQVIFIAKKLTTGGEIQNMITLNSGSLKGPGTYPVKKVYFTDGSGTIGEINFYLEEDADGLVITELTKEKIVGYLDIEGLESDSAYFNLTSNFSLTTGGAGCQ